MYYRRSYEQVIMRALKQFPAILITGPRQSGKSTLLQEAFKAYHYVTLDDPRLRTLANEDPQLFLNARPRPLAIDEVQYAPKLFPYIKMEVDQNRSDYGRFILTGSQTFQVMENVTESLAGRIALFNLYPFSWQEIIAARNKEVLGDAETLDLIVQGSYPEFFVNPDLNPRRWFSGYLATYLERDVRNVTKVSDLSTFQTFIQLLAVRAGSLLNLSEVAKECQISQPTAKQWVSVLESTYIIQRLQPFHANTTKRLVKSPKLYFVDTGLLCYLLGIDSSDRLLENPARGSIFENFVIMEAVKRLALLPEHSELSFYRSASGMEIDLLVRRLNQLFAYEIKLTKSPAKKMARYLTALKDECGINRAQVLTLQDDLIPLTNEVSAVPWHRALDEMTGY